MKNRKCSLIQKHNAYSMDQNIDKLQSSRSRDINEVISLNKNEKQKLARKRWAMLAKALKSPVRSEPSSPIEEFSVRRISSFMLLRTQKITTLPKKIQDFRTNDQIVKRSWYKYIIQINNFEFNLIIGHYNQTFSAEDLIGFNNTGNICIWPSEETLSYYVCANLELFKGKRILELGGGMSCLAGLYAAKYATPRFVTVTDGNKLSVENVRAALYCNDFECLVNCKVLKWGFIYDEEYDIILSADCLFFDDARSDLIECLWSCLHPNGIAFVMAPTRGNTLDNFIAQSQARGFLCKKIINYNKVVWEKRMALMNNSDYVDNIHYPILIEMTKIQVTLA